MTTHDNALTARRVHELFSQGKLDEVAELATPDVTIELLAMGLVFKGREGFMQFMRGFHDAFPDMVITVNNQVAQGDQVVSECSWTGTQRGPLQTPAGALPATGKKATVGRFCEVFTFTGGKMSRLVNYQDPAAWMRQLGLVA